MTILGVLLLLLVLWLILDRRPFLDDDVRSGFIILLIVVLVLWLLGYTGRLGRVF